MLLVKLPVPVPFVVWEPLIRGSAEVLQHIPRAVTGEPPSDVILPPDVAVVVVIPETAVVVIVGLTAIVVKSRSLP
jgi:hypothetical protein